MKYSVGFNGIIACANYIQKSLALYFWRFILFLDGTKERSNPLLLIFKTFNPELRH
jgi:uncharacterized protein involved in tolerance to divalent cations